MLSEDKSLISKITEISWRCWLLFEFKRNKQTNKDAFRTVIILGRAHSTDPQINSCASDPSMTASRTEFHCCPRFSTCTLQSVHRCLPLWAPVKPFPPSPWFIAADFLSSNASLCLECHSVPPLSDRWNPIQLLSLSLTPPSCRGKRPGILLYIPQKPLGHHLSGDLLPLHPDPKGDVITFPLSLSIMSIQFSSARMHWAVW